jgi:hypothetical protein
MESYAFFYGYDDVDFYGPLLSSQYFNEIENGDDPMIEVIAENEEELKKAMDEVHKVALTLGLTLEDVYSKLNNFWQGEDSSIWNIYDEAVCNRVGDHLDSLFN